MTRYASDTGFATRSTDRAGRVRHIAEITDGITDDLIIGLSDRIERKFIRASGLRGATAIIARDELRRLLDGYRETTGRPWMPPAPVTTPEARR